MHLRNGMDDFYLVYKTVNMLLHSLIYLFLEEFKTGEIV